MQRNTGPYRLVRHPGYSGGLLLLLSIGLALGSWIAILPILLIVPFMVRRTLIEERMLAGALPGYANYMQRVRSRIVPGVWWARMNGPPCLILGCPDGPSCDLRLRLVSRVDRLRLDRGGPRWCRSSASMAAMPSRAFSRIRRGRRSVRPASGKARSDASAYRSRERRRLALCCPM